MENNEEERDEEEEMYKLVIDYLKVRPERMEKIVAKILAYYDAVALPKDKILELESIIGQEITFEPQDRSKLQIYRH